MTMTMRWDTVWTLGFSLFLVQVEAATGSKPVVNCIRTLACQFEKDACGFHDSVNWRREHSSSGFYQRYEYVDGSATDLVSPPFCNSVINVRFSSVIITNNRTGHPAELHVLTQCEDNTEGTTFVVAANQNLTPTWKNVTFTLPACPTGQRLKVVFRAVYALPGSVLLLDNVNLQSVEAATGSKPVVNCIRTLACQFEKDACGFHDSVNWRREHSSSGFYQRYEYVDGSGTDLVSPPFCNSVINVHFSSVIITNSITGHPAELHVLTQCEDNTEGTPFVVAANQNLTPTWKNVTFTLPACPTGQRLKVVFRAVYALPGSVLLLDNVNLQSESKQLTGQCMEGLSCLLEDNTCGLLDSDNWKLEHGPTGYYQRYQYTDGTAADLVSPQLCNRAISVHFSCLIITGDATGMPAELHVLRECDDNTESNASVVQTSQNLSSAWKTVSLTLPACPKGQNPSVVFRAVNALPGFVIKLDNIRLETKHLTTTLSTPTTPVTTTSAGHSQSRRKTSTPHSIIRTSTHTPHPTQRHSHLPLTTFIRPRMTSTLPPSNPTSTRSAVASSTHAASAAFSKVTTSAGRRQASSSSVPVATSSHRGITGSTPVTSARNSFPLSSFLTSLKVTTSRSEKPASSRSSVSHVTRSVSTSSTRPVLKSSSSSSQPSVTSQRLPPVTNTQHPSTKASESFSVSSNATTRGISSTVPAKHDSGSNHNTTGSGTASAAEGQSGGTNKNVIIGVTVGVSCTVLALVALIVVVVRRFQLQLPVKKEDKETLIKLKQRLARAESVY